jgi:hypothetical protein
MSDDDDRDDDDRCKDCVEGASPVEPDPAPASSVSALRHELEAPDEQAIISAALTLFTWAIRESRRGRYILAGDPTSGSLHRLVMPPLEHVFRKR